MGKPERITFELAESSPLRHVVRVTIPGEETVAYITKALDELSKDAVIPGFRKSRASREGIRAHFGEKRVREVAAEILARDAFNQVSNSLDKKPITPPEFDLPELNPGEDYTFTASYYIQPPDPQALAKEIAEAHLSGHPYHGQIPPQHTPQIHTPGLNPFQHQPVTGTPTPRPGEVSLPNQIPGIKAQGKDTDDLSKHSTTGHHPEEEFYKPIDVTPGTPKRPEGSGEEE
jgi:hypothetical protein